MAIATDTNGPTGLTPASEVSWRSATAIAVASVVAALCGAAAMTLMAYAMRLAMRLQSDGTVRPQNAIGASGVVYLTVPPHRKGHGKVSVLVQERSCRAR